MSSAQRFVWIANDLRPGSPARRPSTAYERTTGVQRIDELPRRDDETASPCQTSFCSRIDLRPGTKLGTSVCTVSQRISKSIPKYSWMRMLRIPTISAHGMSANFSRIESGT